MNTTDCASSDSNTRDGHRRPRHDCALLFFATSFTDEQATQGHSLYVFFSCMGLVGASLLPDSSSRACRIRAIPSIHSTQRPRNGQQRASLRQCQHYVSALFRRLTISPSRPSVGPFTPPLHRHHRTAMLSLRRARRIRSFFVPALLIRPFFCPPPLPLSSRPHAASAPFFAPLPPPIRTPCKSRCTHVRVFPPCVPRPSPFPPPAPAGVFTHLLFIS